MKIPRRKVNGKGVFQSCSCSPRGGEALHPIAFGEGGPDDLTPASPKAARPLSQRERGLSPPSPRPVGEGKGAGGMG